MQKYLIQLIVFTLVTTIAFLGYASEKIPVSGQKKGVKIKRTNNRSPVFYVAESDLGFFMNYTGFAPPEKGAGEGERFFRDSIAAKALEMIDAAEHTIIMSVFLYDNFYAKEDQGIDIVGKLQAAFLKKRKTNPDIRIAIILDPSHKAYGTRVSPAEKELRANGIDVFYSDLLSGLKKASLLGVREGLGHVGRAVDFVTFNKAGDLSSAIFSRAKIPAKFDGDLLSLESAYNAFLLKANHRKLLVTDVHGSDYEAMITTANPHNASAYHINTAVSVKGDTARYIYNVLRLDMKQSVSLGKRYSHWSEASDKARRKEYFTEYFPSMAISSRESMYKSLSRQIGVTFVSESEIPDAIREMLEQVEEDDEVRIQMFYLSYKPILKAILKAAEKTKKPVRLLLDANKDSFNKEKDGTPNRQVAKYLLEESKNIEVRWYSTHGEQNHAKIMSIVNPAKGKYDLTTGSCNWTGRNMDGVNMEANVLISGSRKLCNQFNNFFDLFWSNDDGNEYSIDYKYYSEGASGWKWKRGEKPFYWSTF